MATSSNEIERIVRKVLNEEQDETIDAIRELSTLLTEQVIPRLSKGDEDVPEADDDMGSDDDLESDEGDVMSMSAFGDEDDPRAGRRAKPNGPNGHDEDQEANPPEQDIPAPVMDAFATLYSRCHPSRPRRSPSCSPSSTANSTVKGSADEAHDEDDVRARA